MGNYTLTFRNKVHPISAGLFFGIAIPTFILLIVYAVAMIVFIAQAFGHYLGIDALVAGILLFVLVGEVKINGKAYGILPELLRYPAHLLIVAATLHHMAYIAGYASGLVVLMALPAGIGLLIKLSKGLVK